MNKQNLSLLLFFFLHTFYLASQTSFYNTYDLKLRIGTDLIALEDGKYLVSGTRYPFGALGSDKHRATLSLYDECGSELWSIEPDLPDEGRFFGRCVRVGSDGSIFIVGDETFEYPSIYKLNSEGELLWSRKYSIENANASCFVLDLIIKEEALYVLSRSEDFFSDFEKFHLTALTPEGEEIWHRDYNIIGSAARGAVAVDNGSAFLVSTPESLIKIGIDGEVVFSLKYVDATDLTKNFMLQGKDIVQDATGYYLTVTDGFSAYNCKIDYEGNVIWISENYTETYLTGSASNKHYTMAFKQTGELITVGMSKVSDLDIFINTDVRLFIVEQDRETGELIYRKDILFSDEEIQAIYTIFGQYIAEENAVIFRGSFKMASELYDRSFLGKVYLQNTSAENCFRIIDVPLSGTVPDILVQPNDVISELGTISVSAGDFVYRPLAVEYTQACSNFNDTEITVDSIVTCGNIPIELNAEVAEETAVYLWSNGSTEPVLEVYLPGVYTVAIEYCGSQKQIIYIIREDENCSCNYEVPNVFTPNGDGTNDNFKPIGECNEQIDYHLEVYNRWGEKVFETQSPGDVWDGNYRGKPASADVYVYRLAYSSLIRTKIESELIIGDVTLLR